jgi:hypothetical protein
MQRIKGITGYSTSYAGWADAVRTRTIEIPAERLAAIRTLPELLEASYHFGQNAYQQRGCPSVTSGDVVAIDFAGWGLRFYRCLGIGWAETSSATGVFGPRAEDMQPGDLGVA